MERHCPLCHHKKYNLKYTADELSVVGCKSCGFVYTLSPSQDSVDADVYEKYHHNSEIVTETCTDVQDQQSFDIFQTRLDTLKQYRKNGSLLELGCGRGYFLNIARQAGYQVKGIEISAEAAHYAGLHYKLDVAVSDFEKMPQPDETFDIIVMWHVLEHFYDPLSVLETLYGMLNDNGIIFIEVPNLNSLKFKISPMQNKWQGGNHPRYHLSFFTMSSLCHMANKAGFSIVENLHIQYPGQNNPAKSFVKIIANRFNLDSFLSVTIQK